MDMFQPSDIEFTQTWTISYSGGVLELNEINILNNFSYTGAFVSYSPTYTGSINETSTWVYEIVLQNYTPKINELNQKKTHSQQYY